VNRKEKTEALRITLKAEEEEEEEVCSPEVSSSFRVGRRRRASYLQLSSFFSLRKSTSELS
jgi:hypothetical protein